MCDKHDKTAETPDAAASRASGWAGMASTSLDLMREAMRDAAARQGSRRRRLWELGEHAQCPVVGVCLPMATLRRLAGKVLKGEVLADDYELHCGVVASTTTRTPMAEAVNKELDRRYAVQVAQAARCKDAQALSAWWAEASRGKDLAGAFWATLSSGRCSAELERRVLGEVHMLQHQMGMATRADLGRIDALLDENAVLARELGTAQRRATELARGQAERIAALEAECMRWRGEVIREQTEGGRLREQLAAIEAAAPQLRTRFDLTRQNHEQAERIEQLQRQLLQARQEAQARQRQLDEAQARIEHLGRLVEAAPVLSAAEPELPAEALLDRVVLCVGGRAAGVPVYRQLIERTGGRFVHHDGGEQDSTSRLDTSLAAADLVICQTGCVSHDAYWRVKDHCKRTGKRCVFVDTPSKAALMRALAEVPAPEASQADASESSVG